MSRPAGLSDENTAEYYRAREQKEREAAAGCVDPAIARIHLDLAGRYAELAHNIELVEARTQRSENRL